MNRVARRIAEMEKAQRQVERSAALAAVEAMATVGREPTVMDYVTYHCYMFVAGNKPLEYEDWVASLGVRNGTRMDGAVP